MKREVLYDYIFFFSIIKLKADHKPSNAHYVNTILIGRIMATNYLLYLNVRNLLVVTSSEIKICIKENLLVNKLLVIKEN